MLAVPDDVNPESLETLFGRVWEVVLHWVRIQLEGNEGRTVFFIDDLETLSIGSSTEKSCIEYLSNLRSTMLLAVIMLLRVPYSSLNFILLISWILFLTGIINIYHGF
jgi:hypothetical protein